MPTTRHAGALNDIYRALRELSSSIYDPRSLKYAYLELDTIASALCRMFPEILPEEDDGDPLSPSEVFRKLVSAGLNDRTVASAAKLQELSSQKWYGIPQEEELLNNADTWRDELHEDLTSFIEEHEEEEEEPEDEGEEDATIAGDKDPA